MAVATLSRGGESIDLQLVEEGGEILVATSFGKPNITVRNGGTTNPRITDQFSGQQTFEIVGKLYDYSIAHDLTDMIKSGSGEPLELSLPGDVYDETIRVAAQQDSALSVEFPAGRKDLVNVSLSLTRIDRILADISQDATTPRATGTGPVQIQIGSTTVDLPTADLSLERSVGRPNDVVRRDDNIHPYYLPKNKVTSDTFVFSWATLKDIPETLNAITDNIFREQLARSGVTVDFNGVLGLGQIEAIPVGSSPFRQVHQAGQPWVNVPQLELRRIHSQ